VARRLQWHLLAMEQDAATSIERERAEAKRDAQWLLAIVLAAAALAVAIISIAEHI
jgi:hypothetical protein